MSLKDFLHKAKVVLGTDEDKTVADEATEELRQAAEDRKDGEDKK